MHTARNKLTEVRHRLRAAGPSMLAADVLFKLAAFIVLWPAAGLVLRSFIAASGRRVLADQDIAAFLLSPVGIACLVVVASMGVAIAALQLTCAIHIVAGRSIGRPVGAARAMRSTLHDLLPVLSLSARVIARVLVLALPFLGAVGLVYLSLLRKHDINYYLADRPPAFWIAAGLAVVILGGLLARLLPRLADWILAIPLLVLERTPASEALRVSTDRTRGRRRRIATMLLIWGLIMTALPAMHLALVVVAARLTIPHLPAALPVIVPVIGAFLLAAILGNLLFSFLQIATLALLIHGLYTRDAAWSPSRADDRFTSGKRGRARTGRWFIVAAAACLAATMAGVILLRGVRLEDHVIIIAHRGGSGAPENSLAAVERGLADGADMIEIDVQETADGEVVVFHDSDFMRTAGVSLRIWDATLPRLREIDIGSRTSSEFSDQRVPLLAEVLSLCRGRARVNIELKVYGHGDRLAERTAAAVDAAEMGGAVVAMSLDHAAAADMKRVRPAWPVGVLAATAVGDLTRVDADFLAVNASMVSRRFLQLAHSRGRQVYAWTVNDPVQMSRLISLGVDGLITDHPAIARRVLAQRAELSSVERLLLQAAYYLGVEPPPMAQ